MSLSSHIEELQKKHHALDAKVEEALRTPGFDDLQITKLKKEKLKLKEEISRLTHA